MKYWANFFGTAGAACVAVTFIEGQMLPLFWGFALDYVGYVLHKRSK